MPYGVVLGMLAISLVAWVSVTMMGITSHVWFALFAQARLGGKAEQ